MRPIGGGSVLPPLIPENNALISPNALEFISSAPLKCFAVAVDSREGMENFCFQIK